MPAEDTASRKLQRELGDPFMAGTHPLYRPIL